MKPCHILQTYQSRPSVDGAGVQLNRLFWRKDTFDMDPFLLLDTFDSHEPSEYEKGFPMHPHRGIETLTYLIGGEILHKDTMGNKDTIFAGECQWMSSGSGILHEEMPQKCEHMLGFQLWINLAQKNKLSEPAYLALRAGDIPVYRDTSCEVRVIAGEFKGVTQENMPSNHQIQVYDIQLAAGEILQIPVTNGDSAFLIPLVGEIETDNKQIPLRMAARYSVGDYVEIKAQGAPARVAFFAGAPFHEPIAWGGSIVMNTEEELIVAHNDLREGTFIKSHT